MSVLTVHPDDQPQQAEGLVDLTALPEELQGIGVQFERWRANRELAADVAVITAYRDSAGLWLSVGRCDKRPPRYEDAARKLKEWWSKGTKLYVFSSGSVYAQKLLFGLRNTMIGRLCFQGILTPPLAAKQEVDSYRKIIGHIGLAPGEILFLCDIKAELDAARAAGMKTIWLVRGR
jgi:2,3-diketo-5-methylthio-1-phosphopentane phosphatase